MDDFDSDWEDPASVARMQAAKAAKPAPAPPEDEVARSGDVTEPPAAPSAEVASVTPPPSRTPAPPVAASPSPPASGLGAPRPLPPRPAIKVPVAAAGPAPSNPMDVPTPVFSFAITPSAAKTRAAVPVAPPEESTKPTQPPPEEDLLESDLLEDRTSARPPPPPPPPPVPARPGAPVKSPEPPHVTPAVATTPEPTAAAPTAPAEIPAPILDAGVVAPPVAPPIDEPAAANEPDDSQVDSSVEQFEDPREELGQRLALGDFSGALDVAEEILITSPDDPAAKAAVAQCRATLIEKYTSRIGSLDRVPQVAVAREQLRWLTIDHRAGFVLSHIDGVSSLEMIVDVSGMSMLDALRILCDLADQRVITFR